MNNQLVKITILNNKKKQDVIHGKIIGTDNNNIVLALGRIGRFYFHIHDKKNKVHWGNCFEIPTYDLKILKHDVLLHLNMKKENVDYKLTKRQNDFNLNDYIRVILLNDKKELSLNENMKYVSTIPNIKNGIDCKIININLWDPSVEVEHNKEVIKIIPGSFSVACGRYTKTIAPTIDTHPIYDRTDICKQSSSDIEYGDCVFTIHFRDIDLVFDVEKIS